MQQRIPTERGKGTISKNESFLFSFSLQNKEEEEDEKKNREKKMIRDSNNEYVERLSPPA